MPNEGITLFNLSPKLLLVHPRELLTFALLSLEDLTLHPVPDRAFEFLSQLSEPISTSGTISCSLAMR